MSASPAATLDGSSLPRSVRWRLQLGLLNIPRLDTGFCDQNRHIVRLQRDRYLKLVTRHQHNCSETKQEFQIRRPTSNDASATKFNIDTIDPLTAAVKRLEVIEEKDKVAIQIAERRHSMQQLARHRKRNLPDKIKYSALENLQVIQKDVPRLNPEHSQYYHSRINWNRMQEGLEPQEFAKSLRSRNAALIQVLHIYCNQHGFYHQGMHEICSFIMLAIEIDLFDQETSQKESFECVLTSLSLLSDTYNLFEALMVPLGKCYEESAQMSNSIVAKLPYVACNKELYNHVQAVPVSHEIYCAKWLRLMFSREVQSWQNVFRLWDVLFDLSSKDPSIISTDISEHEELQLLDTWDLTEVLEMTGASLLWLKRGELLSQNIESMVEILVGCQPLDDIDPLIDTLKSSLYCMQTNSCMAPLRLPAASSISKQPRKKKKGFMNGQLCMDKAKRRARSPRGTSSPHSLKTNTLVHGGRCAGTSTFVLTIHRDSSVQSLMDQSTEVDLLITDSDSDEDGDDYSIADDTHSFACSSIAESSIDCEKTEGGSVYSNYEQRAHDQPNKLARTGLLGFFEWGNMQNLPSPLGKSIELRPMGNSMEETVEEAEASDESSLGEKLSTAEETEQENSTEAADVEMAYCLGYSMAF